MSDSIVKYVHDCGSIENLSVRFEAIGRLRDFSRLKMKRKWRYEESGESTTEAMVVFIGKTGYGKSTTLNSIVGSDVFGTSDTESCTRVCQCLNYRIGGGNWLSFGDLPGVGESVVLDDEYIEMYEDFLSCSSVVVHVLRADTRDYSVDELVLRRLFKKYDMRSRVVYALGQCDKIEPISRVGIGPTSRQMRSIGEKINEIDGIFNPVNRIIPYSAVTGWNLEALIDEVVCVALN